jgi:endonuclease YncB( thermonuclease family)
MNKRIRKSAVMAAVSLMWLIAATSYAWQGKVVGVSDGDTITVMHEGKGEKIRLYGVDTPEKGQDFGQRAKKFTSDLVFGKIVEVDPVATDRYGRTVGHVFMNGLSLNQELIKSGYAWVYKQYCTKPECQGWDKLEAQARDKKLGLWSMPNPIPPWEFRHNRKHTHSAPATPLAEICANGF